MSGTGLVFTGVIGVGLAVPTEVLYVTDSGDGGLSKTLTLPAPTGITVGSLMVACVTAGAYAGGGGPYTLTVPSGWTPVYEDPSDGFTYQIIPNLYSKIADADDAAGTSSYSWTVTVATVAGIAVAHLGWPRQYGRTISGGAANYSGQSWDGMDPSIPSPGGVWQLAFITQRTANAFAQPQPEPVLTSDATLVVPMFGAARSGAMRVYVSDNVSPIAGTFLETGIGDARHGLVVAAVTA